MRVDLRLIGEASGEECEALVSAYVAEESEIDAEAKKWLPFAPWCFKRPGWPLVEDVVPVKFVSVKKVVARRSKPVTPEHPLDALIAQLGLR